MTKRALDDISLHMQVIYSNEKNYKIIEHLHNTIMQNLDNKAVTCSCFMSDLLLDSVIG